ncbi:ComEC/Rec2 family competence protein [Patescibacteria group bacterium]|nr:ComEC/Rec2 family competence protein [Patescibacteria group bacterium]
MLDFINRHVSYKLLAERIINNEVDDEKTIIVEGKGEKKQIESRKSLIESQIKLEEFDYKTYLAQQGISFVMYQPEIELVERGSYEGIFSSAYARVLKLKHMFREVLYEHIRPPQSTILGAILLGDKSAMQDATKEKLNASGLRHITAISGMHVGLLTILLMRLFIWIGLWRHQAFYVTIALMILFIVLTGLQPSAVRAGVMGGMFLLGQHLGRINVSMRALVFAAVIMLVMNPLLLGNVGFQLSFLAVFGILLFLPLLQHVFSRLANPFGLRDVVFMSVAAQIFTLPLVLYHFGILSFVSLATNLLIVPLLPAILFFGILFLFLSMLLPFLSYLFVFPVGLLLSYLSLVITTFAELPFAAGNVEEFPLWVLFPLLIPASIFAWRFNQKKQFRFQEETMIL